jgi:glycerophosphoryl diester phosphodiesterase
MIVRRGIPIVIGHRGASGLRPEHTLAAYALAIDLGADYVEPDLVMTADGILVARHENEIGATTDVAHHPEFAARRTAKAIDGAPVSGWFSEDFTLAELKTLRAVERIPQLRPGNATYDGRFEVPTLQEVIDLVKAKELETGRKIGLYPETKHPGYFESIGLPLERTLVDALDANGYAGADAPVFIQSFDVGSLRDLAGLTDVSLVLLTAARLTPAELVVVSGYAEAIGPEKSLIVPRDGTGRLLAPTSLVEDAHAVGLLVHPYTFRSENAFLPADFRIGDPRDPAFARRHGDAAAEYALFFGLGVDGVFSDFPDAAVAARAAWLAR